MESVATKGSLRLPVVDMRKYLHVESNNDFRLRRRARDLSRLSVSQGIHPSRHNHFTRATTENPHDHSTYADVG